MEKRYISVELNIFDGIYYTQARACGSPFSCNYGVFTNESSNGYSSGIEDIGEIFGVIGVANHSEQNRR